MKPLGIEILGWTATAVFVGSYFFSRPALLRSVQMFGALLWVAYGVLINASPVIVANVLVLSAAAWTAFAQRNVAARADAGSPPNATVPTSAVAHHSASSATAAPVGAPYQRGDSREQPG